MTGSAALLRETVSAAIPLLEAVGEERSGVPRAPGKWCPREVLGHLIDSAANNHTRFVRAQLQEDLVFPGYEQEGWVRVQRYSETPWPELLALWRAYNLQLARVIDAIPRDALERPRRTHNFHQLGLRKFSGTEPAALDDLVVDYVLHLRHHIRQIVALPEQT